MLPQHVGVLASAACPPLATPTSTSVFISNQPQDLPSQVGMTQQVNQKPPIRVMHSSKSSPSSGRTSTDVARNL